MPTSTITEPTKTVVLGGVKSGKSSFAEALALDDEREGLTVHYLATANPGSDDGEMQTRIRHHQQDRLAHPDKANWVVHESPDLLHQLDTLLNETCIVLIECLTLWLAHLLDQQASYTEDIITPACDQLIEYVRTTSNRVILVSNESGLGIIPMNKLSRRYLDTVGILHQRLAKQCDDVYLLVAGLPVTLKAPPTFD